MTPSSWITTARMLIVITLISSLKSIDNAVASHVRFGPETIKICPDCNGAVTVVDGPGEDIDGPVAIQKNFYSFGLWSFC